MALSPVSDALGNPGAPRSLKGTRRNAPTLAVFFAALGAAATSALTTAPAHAFFSTDKNNPTPLTFLAEGITIMGTVSQPSGSAVGAFLLTLNT